MPCDYSEYPKNWPEIREAILERAENRCELCGAENGKPHWKTRSRVVLTIAHLDQDKENNKGYNLAALCQRCHLKIDLPYKIKKRRLERMKKETRGERKIKPERMDHIEKGAAIGRPRGGMKAVNANIENIEINVNDLLIKGLGEKIAKGVEDYIKENNIKKSEVEIDVKLIGSSDPCKIEVLITILKK